MSRTALGLWIVMTVTTAPGIAARLPNTQEEFLHYIAVTLSEPSLCEKISPEATFPGGFSYEPAYARSQCYADCARRMGKASLCLKAKRLGWPTLWSEQISPFSCWRHVAGKSPDESVGTSIPSREEFMALFHAMGYSAPDHDQDDPIHLIGSWIEPTTPERRQERVEFLRRVQTLP